MTTGQRAVVVGDAMVDLYLYGDVDRLSPEAPIPILKVERQERRPGGAANVAANLARLGVATSLRASVGADPEGQWLAQDLASRGVDCQLFRSEQTTRKMRAMRHRQHLARLDFDVIAPADAVRDTFLAQAPSQETGIVVLSDYAKGVCTADLCRRLIGHCHERRIPVLVDPKGVDWERYEGADWVTPNLAELSAVVGRQLANDDTVVAAAGLEVCERFGLKALLITRSDRGMTLVSREGQEHFPTAPVDVFDVTGAGDTVIAAIAAALLRGDTIADAIAYANLAARVVVRKAGTATPSPGEVDAAAVHTKQRSLEALLDEIAEWRSQGQRVVFTNGCFDLLHAGHVSLLSQARRLGDKVVIGLNDDASVHRLKGDGRPLNLLHQRVAVLSALESIDRIVAFPQDTPAEVIRAIRPDVLVKGADYRLEDVVGREDAAETVLIPLSKGLSTTNIASRLQASTAHDGAADVAQVATPPSDD